MQTPASTTMQTQLLDVRRRLDDSLKLIERLRQEIFLLQEQNQQLRRDLADKVCPRLCAHPYRSAS